MTKKIIISLIIALVLFLALAAIIFFILKQGTVGLQAPGEQEQIFEDKIQSVTAPERTEPLSVKEKQRIEKLLKSVTAP